MDKEKRRALKKKAAHELFMSYISIEAIAQKLDTPAHTIRKWTKEWEGHRREESKAILASALQEGAQRVNKLIMGVGLPLLYNSISQIADKAQKEKRFLSLDESQTLIAVMAKAKDLFEEDVKRGLDGVQPASYRPLNWTDLKNMLLNDKLFDLDLIPIKEPKDVTPRREQLQDPLSSAGDGEKGDQEPRDPLDDGS